MINLLWSFPHTHSQSIQSSGVSSVRLTCFPKKISSISWSQLGTHDGMVAQLSLSSSSGVIGEGTRRSPPTKLLGVHEEKWCG